KEISLNCPGLRAIDLSDLLKLTDSAIGHLATGCRAVDYLKLCRNAFSDEAVAAYVETSGDSLKELSLNSVSKLISATLRPCCLVNHQHHKLGLEFLIKPRQKWA
ncbi:hypothetical protein FXO38_22304, partial [Capsicum annuum]